MSAIRIRQPQRRQGGFSMVEILVGVAIGLVGMLVMFQTLSVWDARSRSSSAGGDAQTSGALAMFALERDIKEAGMGFGNAPVTSMGCSVSVTDTVSARAFTFPLQPIEIVDGDGAGVPDKIRVLYGNSAFIVSWQKFKASTDLDKQAAQRNGFKLGDLVVVAGNDTGLPGSATCQLVQVTADSNPDGLTFGHALSANFTNFYTNAADQSKFNPATGTNPTVYTAGELFNLGPSPRYDEWTVDYAKTTLGYTDQIANSPPFLVSEGVVDMKAEYGFDSDNNGQITDAPDEWTKTPTPPINWGNVRAVRVAILVRSRNFEKPAASAADASYVASAPSWSRGPFVMRNVDGTADNNPAGSPNNWRYYRYRVYEKVIPLRNMVWGTSPWGP